MTAFPNGRLLVGADWLAEHLHDPGLRIVEVTSPGAGYRIGHVPGAVYLDLAQVFTGSALGVADTLSRDDEAAAVLGALGIAPGGHVVVYDENGGTRAARTVWLLEYLGFDRVSVLDGGMERWMAEGRPSTRQAPEVQPAAFSPARRDERLAQADWIAARLAPGEIVLLDCRNEDEYAEGHIPGAVNRPWQNSLTRHAYQTLRDPAELRSEFERLGAAPDRPIVTYCGTGARSAHTYLTLRALGYEQVRNYSGSWSEWSGRGDLPKEGGDS